MAIIIGDSSAAGDTSQVDICNLALRRIGAQTIAAIGDTTKMAEHCNAFWAYVLDEVLSDHQWSFTKRVVKLDYTAGFGVYSDTDIQTITGITQADPAVVSVASHPFVDGNTVYIYDVSGMTEVNDSVYLIADVAGESFQLVGFDSTKWTAYTSGGKCYRKESDPKYANGYTYDLPADCLRTLHLQDKKTSFEILGYGSNRRLLTTQPDAILTYNMLEETTDNFLTRFVNSMAWRLAAELAIPLGKQSATHEWAMQMYGYTLAKMSTIDAKSDRQDLDDYDSWISAGSFE